MKRKIVFILAILVLLFIWGQSLLPQAVSARESGWITLNIVRPLLSLFGINTISGNLVRKLAHVTEFFVLSTLVTLPYVSSSPSWMRASSSSQAEAPRSEMYG